MSRAAPNSEKVPLWHRFVAGGIGDVFAAFVTHPADVLKVRMQLQGELSREVTSISFKSMANTTRSIVGAEGMIGGLYRGLSASILRQATFSSCRHGNFGVISAYWQSARETKTVSLPEKIVIGCLSGGSAAVVANPSDIVLVRMQADGHWPVKEQRGYRHVFHGIHQIATKEGVWTLWRGCSPTVVRAMLVTSSQISAYETTKQQLMSHGWDDSLPTHLVSSIVSATSAALVTTPVDTVKTRRMNMKDKDVYKNSWDCVVKTWQAEGFRGFYKGLYPTFARLAPHTIILWLVQERVSKVLREL